MNQSQSAARDCQVALEEAQKALTLAVSALYPRDARVNVRLLPGRNSTETWGKVIEQGHGATAGYVRVRLETQKRLVRNFWWDRLEA
jgi:hypothetical protein